ncbi:MAG: hypothetical protein JO204_13670 [Alphaproteobacteria bacterium]|nr:hypothetical protein [Alphaproteobacteria bacterium]
MQAVTDELGDKFKLEAGTISQQEIENLPAPTKSDALVKSVLDLARYAVVAHASDGQAIHHFKQHTASWVIQRSRAAKAIDRARVDYRSLNALNLCDVRLENLMALALFEAGDYEDAQTHINNALDSERTRIICANGAVIELALNNAVGCLALFDEALRSDETDVLHGYYQDTFSRALFRAVAPFGPLTKVEDRLISWAREIERDPNTAASIKYRLRAVLNRLETKPEY